MNLSQGLFNCNSYSVSCGMYMRNVFCLNFKFTL